MDDSHRQRRESLGAYVLGQLDPAERDAVRAHLATCADCRAEVAELEPVAGALAAVKRARALSDGSVPPGLGSRMDAAIASEAGRRRRSRVTRAAGTLLVAAALVVLGVLGVASLLDRTPAAPVPEVVAVVVAPELDSVTASAGLIAHTWGTEVKLQTAGLVDGATYQAVVLGPDEVAFPAGTFTGTGAATINCNLQTSVLRADASGFQILDAQGQVVISSVF